MLLNKLIEILYAKLLLCIYVVLPKKKNLNKFSENFYSANNEQSTCMAMCNIQPPDTYSLEFFSPYFKIKYFEEKNNITFPTKIKPLLHLKKCS